MVELLELKQRKLTCKLKQTIAYKGPDPDRQLLALSWLARIIGYDVYPLHERIIRHQNRTQHGDRDSDLTLGFRGLGKSTIGTVVRAIKYIIDDPDVRILIVSDSGEAAARFLREITNHLRDNKQLVEMFGKFFGDESVGEERGRKRKGFATVLQRSNPQISEPTIMSLGIGSQLASYHFDVIFLDDVVTIRNSRTPVQRGIVRDWHGSTLLGATIETSRLHYLGTRYYPHDLYQDLTEGREDEGEAIGDLAADTLYLPAWVEDPPGSGEYQTQFPERFTTEFLKARQAKMGRYHFAAQMLQDTKSGEGIIFNWADFKWYNRKENYPDVESLTKYQGFDLVAKKTDTGAFFAGVTLGVTPDKSRIYVLDMVRGRMSMTQQRQAITNAAMKWNPIRAGVEATQMQAGFAEEIREFTMLPIQPVDVETDKVFRAWRVAPQVEAGKVFFPMDPLPAAKTCEKLLEELTTFPDSEFKDCVDAFVMALTLAMLGGAPATMGGGGAVEQDDGLLGDYDLLDD